MFFFSCTDLDSENFFFYPQKFEKNGPFYNLNELLLKLKYLDYWGKNQIALHQPFSQYYQYLSSLYCSLYIPYDIYKGNLTKLLEIATISLTPMTLMFHTGVIFLGETRYLSLLDVEGLIWEFLV